jgi:hypothetical protein
MAASGKQKTPELDAKFCEIWEEQQHWKRAHPEVTKKKSDHAKYHACSQKHAAEINGTPEQARAALDLG